MQFDSGILPSPTTDVTSNSRRAFSVESLNFWYGASQALKDLTLETVSYTHLRAHETVLDLVCRLLLEKKKQ